MIQVVPYRITQTQWLTDTKVHIRYTAIGDIHRGDAPARLIRGQTSIEEREALRDEGIEVLSLPIPEGLEGPIQ